jgi:C4-dicarboxylate transporter, DctM subunit
MIIYGVMTDTQVPKLYLAGFIPGFILTAFFSLTVLIGCIWRPHWAAIRSRPIGGRAFPCCRI